MRLNGHKYLTHALFFLAAMQLTIFWQSQAMAGHLSGSLGYFSLKAKTSDGTATISNVGLLRALYDHQISNQISLMMGYSLYSLSTLTSDMGYGIDFGAKYFPISKNRIIEEGSPQLNLIQRETFRPFVAFSFAQRQYQSIQSSYVGPGLEIGTEWVPSSSYYLTGGLRYLHLRGPAGSSIQDISLNFGAGLPL